ncbi:MAG: efflux RND transporter periplasmic adaptor subunit [Rhodobacteraceae bacterium]|nr:efflux RND transporter periplasmic adaptor subunit [Paracoccaceae bacterium]
MRIKFSYLLALGLAVGTGVWMYSGSVVVGGQADSENATPPPAERNIAAVGDPFKVQVRKLTASERSAQLEIRGRTEANARVSVHAETAAKIVSRPVSEGARVSAGDILCELDKGARKASVLQAKAALEQAQLEYDAAHKLNTKGFSAQTSVAAKKAQLDAAKAGLESAELELDYTTIRAPIDGVVESPMADIGARLGVGGACASIVNTDPLLAIGQVSEHDIASVELGMSATVNLVTGQTFPGKVTYIAPSADTNTRTFRVEIEIDNKDGEARDGITAVSLLQLKSAKAHKVSQAIMSLSDSGQVGVRTVSEDNVVRFVPVTVLGGERDGVWIGGLPDEVTVITVGQDYVSDGETVTPVLEMSEAS